MGAFGATLIFFLVLGTLALGADHLFPLSRLSSAFFSASFAPSSAFFFFFQGTVTLSRKMVQKVSKLLDTHCGAMECNFSIFGKGRHVDHTHSRSGFPIQNKIGHVSATKVKI